jgi:prolyl-tRNA synthetase
VRSYKALPLNLYHTQWKFRDEVRPRFGVMRGREFLMKDAYSFDLDKEAARRSYNRMYVAYLRAFDRMGLVTIPMRADTGPIGGDLSHEFHVLAETGESQVYLDQNLLDMPIPPETVDFDGDLEPIVQARSAMYAATGDVHDQARFEAEVPEARRMSTRGIEVGQIFYFGSKYSAPMKANVTGPDGKDVPVEMGSYGIGVSRLVGAIIEASHDEAGIVWPEPVAPFDIGLVNLKSGDAKTDAACDDLYAKLTAATVDVLYDDTAERPGAKFASMDLIGLPWQVVVGPRGLEKGLVEIKNRKTGVKEELSADAVVNKFAR